MTASASDRTHQDPHHRRTEPPRHLPISEQQPSPIRSVSRSPPEHAGDQGRSVGSSCAKLRSASGSVGVVAEHGLVRLIRDEERPRPSVRGPARRQGRGAVCLRNGELLDAIDRWHTSDLGAFNGPAAAALEVGCNLLAAMADQDLGGMVRLLTENQLRRHAQHVAESPEPEAPAWLERFDSAVIRPRHLRRLSRSPSARLRCGGASAGQPSLGRPRRRLRMACWMRFSFSMRANRTKPSPPGPKPTPGDSATSASRTIIEQNSTESISA